MTSSKKSQKKEIQIGSLGLGMLYQSKGEGVIKMRQWLLFNIIFQMLMEE
jgi:hypothetical protein